MPSVMRLLGALGGMDDASSARRSTGGWAWSWSSPRRAIDATMTRAARRGLEATVVGEVVAADGWAGRVTRRAHRVTEWSGGVATQYGTIKLEEPDSPPGDLDFDRYWEEKCAAIAGGVQISVPDQNGDVPMELRVLDAPALVEDELEHVAEIGLNAPLAAVSRSSAGWPMRISPARSMSPAGHSSPASSMGRPAGMA